MQMKLPMFSKWHDCLDMVSLPINESEPCPSSNPGLWMVWCHMTNRPPIMDFVVWTEKDVVDWVNCTIRMEIESSYMEG